MELPSPLGLPERQLKRPGGAWLHWRAWLPRRPRLSAPRQPAGVVLLVHGLGEHSGRYASVVSRLVLLDLAVVAFDQYGHGRSSGARGTLPGDDRLLDDLAAMMDEVRAQPWADGLPLVLMGHSMGGLVAARAVSLALRPVDALVLSSPALDPGMGLLRRGLTHVAAATLPELALPSGLPLDRLSHDPGIVAEVAADRLCHQRISGRLARFILSASAATMASAPGWRVPTLIVYAGDDRLVNPGGSSRFAAAAPPGCVTARRFTGYYHEILFEIDAEPVYDVLLEWLEQWLRTHHQRKTAARADAASPGP